MSAESKYYKNLQNLLGPNNNSILSVQMRQFKKIHENLDIRVFFAIMHLKNHHDSYNMHALFYVQGKKWWNKFINENNTLSHEQKKEYIITNSFY